MKDKKNTYQSANDSLSYTGNLTMQLRHGDKILATSKFKNNGGPELFKFLCNCIAGNYETANSGRPIKLALFTFTDDTVQPNDIINTTPFYSTSSKSYSATNLTNFIMATGVVEVDANNPSAMFHFTIPATAFNTTTGFIKQVAIFKQGANSLIPSDLNNSFSAYYLATKEISGAITWSDSSAVNLTEITANTNNVLYIDWKMEIKNS